jgi:GT2 family glycosyltransferase
MDLPRVLVTSVIRSTRQGQSHGGLYRVDLASGAVEQIIDWDDGSISWEGRGGDRGLRGIAYYEGQILLAASDAILVYDQSFQLQRTITNAYLRHCHEIDVDGHDLYMTSCGLDSILQYDLRKGEFVTGYCLRYSPLTRKLNGALKRAGGALGRAPLTRCPKLSQFDPNAPGGPADGDSTHINSVTSNGGKIFVSGVGLGHLYCIEGGRLTRWARVPFGTHNAQPYKSGVVLNHTAGNAVLLQDRGGEVTQSFAIPAYEEALLSNRDIPDDHARQAFGRGLTVWADRYLIAGSSPGTVSVHDLVTNETEVSVNLSLDVRNAVHGLEVWPPAFSPDPVTARGGRAATSDGPNGSALPALTTVGAVMTVHNRRDKTLSCLAAIEEQATSDLRIETFVVDDGSTDGTADAIAERHPTVTVLRGSGDLYWNRGMGMALEAAYAHDFDYYLWLNDDTMLDGGAVETLVATAQDLRRRGHSLAIVNGSTRDPDSGELTYGGIYRPSRVKRTRFVMRQPSDAPQEVETSHGNILLVPHVVAARVGNIDPAYDHAAGDEDYGLRVRQAGGSVWIAPGTLGTCPRNPEPEYGHRTFLIELREEWGIKRLPLRPWATFTRRWAGPLWFLYFISPYLHHAARLLRLRLRRMKPLARTW